MAHIFYADADAPDQRIASGTGVLIREDGVMVTAAHVVSEGELVDIRFSGFEGDEDAPFLPAWVVTVDEVRDVALLVIDQSWVESSVGLSLNPVEIGEPVTVFGYPESNVVGLEMRRSTGVISARRHNPLGEDDTRMIELEAKIEPGNSGSPVFNDAKRVVGVVSSRWETTDSYALAAPSSVVRDLLEGRFPEELRESSGELEAVLDHEIDAIMADRTLLEGLYEHFESDEEGAERLSELSSGLSKAAEEARLAKEALSSGQMASGWRHTQMMAHYRQVHAQDVAFLRATGRAIEALDSVGD